jgi:hypothetical protein
MAAHLLSLLAGWLSTRYLICPLDCVRVILLCAGRIDVELGIKQAHVHFVSSIRNILETSACGSPFA